MGGVRETGKYLQHCIIPYFGKGAKRWKLLIKGCSGK